MNGLLLALVCLLAALPARAERYDFALIGDLPYGAAEREAMPGFLVAIARRAPAFIIHVGDFKAGSAPCDDTVFDDRLALFDASTVPLIFMPGDNDWLDCRRRSAGGFEPAERLAQLRKRFFATEQSLGRRRIGLTRQGADGRFAEFREHVRWVRGPVLFVGANVTGSRNGWPREGEPMQPFRHRAEAVAAWLDAAFAQAQAQSLRAVVIFIQANPGFETAARRPDPVYADFLAQLLQLCRAFKGQVVLVHGDSHAQRIDRPLRDPQTDEVVENLLRVETHGSPFMGWTRVSVDPEGPILLRFEAIPHPRIGEDNGARH